MAELTLLQIKESEKRIQELLDSIPYAACNPFHRYEALSKEIEHLEKAIGRLKRFIEFLRKLNPMQYIKWMHHAFSSYSPSQSAQHAPMPEQTIPEHTIPQTLPVTPSQPTHSAGSILTPKGARERASGG